MARPVYFSGDLAPITTGMLRNEELQDRRAAANDSFLAELARNRTAAELGRGQQNLTAAELGMRGQAMVDERDLRRDDLGFRKEAFGKELDYRDRVRGDENLRYTMGVIERRYQAGLIDKLERAKLAEMAAARGMMDKQTRDSWDHQVKMWQMSMNYGTPEAREMYNEDLAKAQLAETLAMTLNSKINIMAPDVYDEEPFWGTTGKWSLSDRNYARTQLGADVIPETSFLNVTLPNTRAKIESQMLQNGGFPEEWRFIRVNPTTGRYYADKRLIRGFERFGANPGGQSPGTSPLGANPFSQPSGLSTNDGKTNMFSFDPRTGKLRTPEEQAAARSSPEGVTNAAREAVLGTNITAPTGTNLVSLGTNTPVIPRTNSPVIVAPPPPLPPAAQVPASPEFFTNTAAMFPGPPVMPVANRAPNESFFRYLESGLRPDMLPETRVSARVPVMPSAAVASYPSENLDYPVTVQAPATPRVTPITPTLNTGSRSAQTLQWIKQANADRLRALVSPPLPTTPEPIWAEEGGYTPETPFDYDQYIRQMQRSFRPNTRPGYLNDDVPVTMPATRQLPYPPGFFNNRRITGDRTPGRFDPTTFDTRPERYPAPPF